MSHDYYDNDNYSRSLDRTAQRIADELDYGDPRYAVERLRDELYRNQRDPEYAKTLVDLVKSYDQRGAGADLAIRYRSSQGQIYEEVGVTQSRYYDDYNRGRTPGYNDRNFSRIATIRLGTDESYYDRYSDGRSSGYYDRNGRTDPRYDQRYTDPRYSDPRYSDPRYDQRYTDPRYSDQRYSGNQRYLPQQRYYSGGSGAGISIGPNGFSLDFQSGNSRYPQSRYDRDQYSFEQRRTDPNYRFRNYIR